MFERSKNKSTEIPEPVPNAVQSEERATYTTGNARSAAMIGPSIVIKGTVTGDENLVVQGRVEGSIDLAAHEVSVGESGQVDADIIAKVVKIDGNVAGDVTGKEKVIITRSGNVRGNIVAPRVTLEDGAVFKGSIDMDPGDSAPAAKPFKPVSEAAPKSDAAPELDLKSG